MTNYILNAWLHLLECAPEYIDLYKIMCSEAFNVQPCYEDEEEGAMPYIRRGGF